MSRVRKYSRRFLNLAPYILLLLLLAGAVTGQYIGRRLQALDEERQMGHYTQALLSYAARLVNFAQNTLDQAEQSPYLACSVDDQTYLRKILFAAYQIKDVGRLVDNKLQCSTLLGALVEPVPTTAADLEMADGTIVFADGPLRITGSYGAVMNRGNSNVVLSPVAFDLMHTPRYAFAVFITDPSRTHFARLYAHPLAQDLRLPPAATHLKFVSFGDRFIQYECDEASEVCIALQADVDRTSLAARLRVFLSVFIGMLLTGGLGLVWIMYRNRGSSLMALLSRALAKKQLDVVYQPVVNMLDGEVTGFEALIRWELQKGEFIPPDVFIPRAEQSGLIRKITPYILETIAAEMGTFLRGRSAMRISINISAQDLDDVEFEMHMESLLAAASIAPQQIGLELTERTAVDFATASSGIQRLREKGHYIYIDDFGTGYSSLSYLGELKVDAIKIDKSFTRTASTDKETVSILPQILSMAHEHGLDVVVEGVETEAQALYFRQIGMPVQAQGWYFGKPMTAADARAFVASSAAERRKFNLS